MILQAVVGGFVLDELFGDPAWLPHPVVLMGRCISRLEKFLRARLPGTPQGELLGGAVTAFCLPVGTFLVTSLVCLACIRTNICPKTVFGFNAYQMIFPTLDLVGSGCNVHSPHST